MALLSSSISNCLSLSLYSFCCVCFFIALSLFPSHSASHSYSTVSHYHSTRLLLLLYFLRFIIYSDLVYFFFLLWVWFLFRLFIRRFSLRWLNRLLTLDSRYLAFFDINGKSLKNDTFPCISDSILEFWEFHAMNDSTFVSCSTVNWIFTFPDYYSMQEAKYRKTNSRT